MDIYVINLKTRPDRLNIFSKNCKIEKVKFKNNINKISARKINGNKHIIIKMFKLKII